MKGENWEEMQRETGRERIQKAGDFSIIVDPYLWRRLENDDDINTNMVE